MPRRHLCLPLICLIMVHPGMQKSQGDDLRFFFKVIYISPTSSLRPSIDFKHPENIQNIGDCLVQSIPEAVQITGSKCDAFPDSVDNLYPSLKVIVVYTASITTIHDNAFVNQTFLEKLEVISSGVSNLESRAFNGLQNLIHLSLAGNPISSLPDGIFNGLANLQYLSLFSTEFNQLSVLTPHIMPQSLPKLELFNFGHTKISRIDQSDLQPLGNSTLKYLQLHHSTKLTYVHPMAFAELTNLEGLFFRSTAELDADMLAESLKNVRSKKFNIVDVSHLKSATFPTGLLKVIAKSSVQFLIYCGAIGDAFHTSSFPLMKKIKTLILQFNNLDFIPEKGFDVFPSLRQLDLTRNLMQEIPKGILLRRLEYLDLSGYGEGGIKLSIPDNTFADMTNLRSLIFSRKPLNRLRPYSFAGLINLEYLDLSMSKIDYLPEKIFSSMKRLKTLKLKGNPVFQSYSVNLFQPLKLLTYLDLSDTLLPSLNRSGLFSNLTSLSFLDLSNNTIHNFGECAFRGSPNIQTIYLSENGISCLKPNAFACLPNLTSLDLSYNRIEYIPEGVLWHFRRIRHLNISKNPFSCSCDLIPLINWMPSTNVTLYAISSKNSHVCQKPSLYRGEPILGAAKYLNLECSPYTKITLVCASLVLLAVLAAVIGVYFYRRRIKSVGWWSDAPESDADYMFDAFVSYSNSDSSWVINELIPHLENDVNKLKLCIYDRDFLAGQNISDCILASIKHSRKIILVLSNSFLKSPWCRFETDLAQYTLLEQNRQAFILLRIDDLDEKLMSQKMRFLLKTRIYLSWSKNPDEQRTFWEKLQKTLTAPNGKVRRSSARLKNSIDADQRTADENKNITSTRSSVV